MLREWFVKTSPSNLSHPISPLATGCELVSDQIGIPVLLDLSRYACQSTANEAAQLRMITLGALHNITNSNGNEINRLGKFQERFCVFRKNRRIDLERRFISNISSLCSPFK